ncbi:MAG TPA: tetratricopeptide repeat protein [Gemmatimonadaceae bacterium]|nr:tetratricopeptide repeat protein [Gemmatimonadaceae bacterium]
MDYDRLRELQEKFEENPRRYFAPLANEYRKGGQPKRAIEICRAQLAQMPGHMSGLIVFGQALYEATDFEEARQVFERALTLDPENLIALRSLGDMSLQSGNTAEARRWYTRLLDADPKDTAVIALVSEIEESAEAAPLAAPDNFPVDTDGGDQPIPFIADASGAPIEPELEPEPQSPAAPKAAERQPTASSAPSREPEPVAAAEPPPPPLGLERHYPDEASASEPSHAEREPVEPPAARAPAVPAPFEDEIPLGAEGLHSAISTEPRGAESLRSLLKPAKPAGAEGLRGSAAPEEPVGTEGLKGKPVASPLEGAAAKRSDDDAALDAWTPPPGANVHERAPSPKDERMFAGSTPEPFVNETMAQLYLQQGYRQLALKVYYQLAEARPNDQGLKDRIAEIEAADRAAHPEAVTQALRQPPPVERPSPPPVETRRDPPPAEAPREPPPVEARREPPPVEARREPAPIERPSPPPAAPRSPSIESPAPGGAPESEESPSFDRTPVDSPPSRPSPGRESVESPVREEPLAEPEGIAARQPSIKEFFATLGRRRPPRAGAAGGGASMRATPAIPSEPAPLPPSGPAPSLDAVFAGASVDPADSRAAARLAGAFSGSTGGTSRTPPTPPTPTPRVNPRMPQAQESEEDVAKFRAWLDGLTGE